MAAILRIVVLAACLIPCTSLHAQETSPVDGVEPPGGVTETQPIAPSSDPGADLSQPIGGGPELVGTYYYNSPLKQFGSDLLVGSYALNLFVSLGYLAVVYPLQALFGSNKVEPVMLWMLLPIAGPFFAQYEDSVKSKPFWRVVLVGDAALQASGLVIGLIGLALSGKRAQNPRPASGVELKLGVQGAGLAGLTLSVNTL